MPPSILTAPRPISERSRARSRRARPAGEAGIGRGIKRRIGLRQQLLEPSWPSWRPGDFRGKDLPALRNGAAVVAALEEVRTGVGGAGAEAGQGQPLCVKVEALAIVGRPQCRQIQPAQCPQPAERAIRRRPARHPPIVTWSEKRAGAREGGAAPLAGHRRQSRPTDDPIEQLGIARSHQAMATGRMRCLLLVDLAEGWTNGPTGTCSPIARIQCPSWWWAHKADLAGVTPGLLPDADRERASIGDHARPCAGHKAWRPALLQALQAKQPRSWPGGGAETGGNGSGRRPPAGSLDRSLEAAAQSVAYDSGLIDLRQRGRPKSRRDHRRGKVNREACSDRVFARFCIGNSRKRAGVEQGMEPSHGCLRKALTSACLRSLNHSRPSRPRRHPQPGQA